MERSTKAALALFVLAFLLAIAALVVALAAY